MTILEALQSLPHVKVILSDAEKTICSVRVTVERLDRIDSGSMMFHHPRYITFGQIVIFSDKAIEDDQCGALVFSVKTDEEAVSIVENIQEYIPFGKEKPKETIIIESKV